MPNSDFDSATPRQWLARAKSNFALAGIAKPQNTFWDDLCFNAQQAAEKAIKAVLLYKGITFRYVHDLDELLTTLKQHGLDIPEEIQNAACLTEYAVETRYPGDYEPVTEEEYRQAIQHAEHVLTWAESIVCP